MSEKVTSTLFALILAAAVHIGVLAAYTSFYGFFAVFGLLVLQNTLLARFKSVECSNKVLFVEIPLAFLLFYNNLWPVISLKPLLIFVGLLMILHLYLVMKRIKDATTLNRKLLLWYIPLVIVLIQEPHNNLIEAASEWRLLAEEGQIMGWITKIRHGGIPYVDAMVTRGPLVIYTAAGFMEVAGNTLLSKRICFFFLNLAMAFCYYYFCRTIIASNFLRIGAFLIMLLIHNFTYRTGFAVLALAFFIEALMKEKPRFGVASGICMAAALAASIEAGICAAAAIFAGLCLNVLREGRTGFSRNLKLALNIILPVIVIFVPVISWLLITGRLDDLFFGLVVYPKYAMLGFAALPFPNLIAIIHKELGNGGWTLSFSRQVFILWYMPVLIYLFTFFIALKSPAQRQLTVRQISLLIVSFYGWLLFRSVLGRSDLNHLYFCIPPVFALLYAHVQDVKSFAVKAILFMIPLVFLFQRSEELVDPTVRIVKNNFTGNSEIRKGLEPAEIDALKNIRYSSRVKKRLESIASAIQLNRKPSDVIYAFPNMPLYYFVLDAPNPTRYEWAYQAITTEMRNEAVRDLEKSKPDYIIYSHDPRQRLDRIEIRDAVPEIDRYIKKNYIRWVSYGREEILVPNGTDTSKLRKPDIRTRETVTPEPEETQEDLRE